MNVSSSELTEKELGAILEKAAKLVEIGAVYSHYRDRASRYKVLNLVLIEATQEPGVMYQKEGASIIWIRPVSSWMEQVQDDKGFAIQRFMKVNSLPREISTKAQFLQPGLKFGN